MNMFKSFMGTELERTVRRGKDLIKKSRYNSLFNIKIRKLDNVGERKIGEIVKEEFAAPKLIKTPKATICVNVATERMVED